MVISNIKLGFAQKKVTDLSRKFSLSAQESSVKRVCVILDEADARLMNKFKEFAKDLNVKEDNFKMLICLSTRSKEKDLESIVFRTSDLTWSGKIRNSEIQNLLKEHFDLLISFTAVESKTANFITAALSADLKVNRREETASGFDLTISTGYKELDVFMTELKKYLKILNRIRE
ncbi:hypothetical protein GCM10007103_15500 [Salinimicrobium marinum]|uniref:Uncharacterized protein n=1 Tax=Salinimicrobium marinum TaxID=680283 RepID=A0A918VYJ9_9FLAO|nr:hypothetical protein GCM10007103_15500 [Salinimicrobium marinum]